MTSFVVETCIKIAVVLAALMTAAAYLVLVERWVAAWVQDRLGPNRVGIPLTKIRIFGLGQPIADGLKLIFKEEFVPGHVDRVIYNLAPIVTFVAAIAVYAVVPLGQVDLGITNWAPVDLTIVPKFDAALIFLFAANGAAVYGVILAGWGSNNKYSLFGAMRGAAQLIAYEIPLSLALIALACYAGTLRIDEIVVQQAQSGVWNILLHPLAFVVFFVAATAEAGRLPFDLPETEQELVGGFHTEYGGMRLMTFLVSEFLHMITAAVLIVLLFLGGWHLWFLTGSEPVAGIGLAILRIIVFVAKVLGVVFFFMLMRWSWPRFRFDQLMTLAWKALISWGMIQVTILILWYAWWESLIVSRNWPATLSLAAINWTCLLVTWIITAAVSRPNYDNRPRRDLAQLSQQLWRQSLEMKPRITEACDS
ncbi:MAG: complex I subunit 1/NuoH family protein [Thermogutta sp.]